MEKEFEKKLQKQRDVVKNQEKTHYDEIAKLNKEIQSLTSQLQKQQEDMKTQEKRCKEEMEKQDKNMKRTEKKHGEDIQRIQKKCNDNSYQLSSKYMYENLISWKYLRAIYYYKPVKLDFRVTK